MLGAAEDDAAAWPAIETSQIRLRWVAEPPKRAGRSDFERDRARVLHSAALRRLAAKTQVVERFAEARPSDLQHSIRDVERQITRTNAALTNEKDAVVALEALAAAKAAAAAAAVLERGMAEAIVSRALLRVLEDIIGRTNRLEMRLLLGTAVVLVRMAFLGEPAIGGLDGRLAHRVFDVSADDFTFEIAIV